MATIRYKSTRGRTAGTMSKGTTAALALLDKCKSEKHTIELERADGSIKTSTLEGIEVPANVTSYHVGVWASKKGKQVKVHNFGGQKVAVLTAPSK